MDLLDPPVPPLTLDFFELFVVLAEFRDLLLFFLTDDRQNEKSHVRGRRQTVYQLWKGLTLRALVRRILGT